MKIRNLLAALMMTLLGACATGAMDLLGTTGWQEEVELHDGRKIVVDRYQSYGGLHEIGQGSPIKTQGIDFTVPGTRKRYSFKSEYSEDVGRANLLMMALHIKDETPYLVTEPHLCLAYNKWGRPNPPYVIFKHDGQDWTRIPLEELPPEFKTMNLVISTKNKEEKFRANGVLSAEMVRAYNKELRQPEYDGILRESLPGTPGGCSRMIHVKSGWQGLGFFQTRGSRNACWDYCERQGVAKQDCPCDEIFEGK